MTKRAAFRVIESGMLTTVQDLGRAGWTGIGVGRGGAADTLSLRTGNRLVGNQDGAAALEMTLTGGTFEFVRGAIAVLTGAAATARIDGRKATRPVPDGNPFEIYSGERLIVGAMESGARTYLCVAGGILVPDLLGSKSTHLRGAFGGVDGRALRPGDGIDVGKPVRNPMDSSMAQRAREFCRPLLARRSLRAVEGAHGKNFDEKSVESFWASAFEVSMQSDRTGLRLSGRIEPPSPGGRMPSEGMMQGAVQVPESGAPIVLAVDHPTTGGYPVIACVAAVDHAALGQIRPLETLRFERVRLAEARALFADQERRFNAEVPPR